MLFLARVGSTWAHFIMQYTIVLDVNDAGHVQPEFFLTYEIEHDCTLFYRVADLLYDFFGTEEKFMIFNKEMGAWMTERKHV